MSAGSSFKFFGLVVLLLAQWSCAFGVASQGCAVVGCGVLGTAVCKQILSSPQFDSCNVTGITRSKTNHASILAQMGESHRFSVRTAEEVQGQRFHTVVFCAPPSGFDDYPAAVTDAVCNLWGGPSDGGVFVFTSSGGIYGSGDVLEVVHEGSAVADPAINQRLGRLIQSEEAVTANGGTCLRLAGLYNLNRGAHNVWLTSGKDVRGRSDGLINLLHYDDAASAVLAALEAGSAIVNGKVFLISDGHPMTRREICESALEAERYRGMPIPRFLGSTKDPVGKIYDGSKSNKVLGWEPRYKQFTSFIRSLP